MNFLCSYLPFISTFPIRPIVDVQVHTRSSFHIEHLTEKIYENGDNICMNVIAGMKYSILSMETLGKLLLLYPTEPGESLILMERDYYNCKVDLHK